jgi:hypothetical protein
VTYTQPAVVRTDLLIGTGSPLQLAVSQGHMGALVHNRAEFTLARKQLEQRKLPGRRAVIATKGVRLSAREKAELSQRGIDIKGVKSDSLEQVLVGHVKRCTRPQTASIVDLPLAANL